MRKEPDAQGPADEPLPDRRTCATMRVHHRLLEHLPEYAGARAASENHARAFSIMRGMVDSTGITVIPVVVHVVYDPRRPEQNISDEQIQSQIDALNRDYRAKNPDLAHAPAVFREFAADARIEFELATTDPEGNPTNGVTRTASRAGPFADDDSVKASATGGADPWPSDRYLNLWVCQLGGGLLGYAQFPGGPPETDGVVILYRAFGTTGTAGPPFNLGRTTTHEIGHWLNLRHIWGDDGDGCSGSDYVQDTPNQGGPNYGKPSFPKVSCNNAPNGDMFMDYLDYVDDDIMCMFTAGQVERMHACLNNERASIGRIKEDDSTAPSPSWPPAPVPVEDGGPATEDETPGPMAPPFAPFSWPGMGFGLLPWFLDLFGPPRSVPPFAPWGSGFSPFLFPGSVPLPAPGGAFPPGPPSMSSGVPEGQASFVPAMFESQLKAYEHALRMYNRLPATGPAGPWRKQQIDMLYQAYLSLVREYRRYLQQESARS